MHSVPFWLQVQWRVTVDHKVWTEPMCYIVTEYEMAVQQTTNLEQRTCGWQQLSDMLVTCAHLRAVCGHLMIENEMAKWFQREHVTCHVLLTSSPWWQKLVDNRYPFARLLHSNRQFGCHFNSYVKSTINANQLKIDINWFDTANSVWICPQNNFDHEPNNYSIPPDQFWQNMSRDIYHGCTWYFILCTSESLHNYI